MFVVLLKNGTVFQFSNKSVAELYSNAYNGKFFEQLELEF